MREILFRGRRIDNGEWVEGDLIRYYENQRRFIACDQMAYTYTECGIDRLVSERYYEVDPATIGQFTGLTDKNGKKIFDGDIVKNQYGKTGVVEFHIGQFVVRFGKNYWHSLNNHMPCVLIGNIHDSPDLLNE